MNKQDFLSYCLVQLEEKKQRLLKDAADLSEAIAQDDKSSAGDKYETSREMSQQELDKVNASIAEIKRSENQVVQFKDLPKSDIIQAGSLIKTSQLTLLFGLPIGSIPFEDTTVIGIGASAPLAQQLLGKRAGDVILFQGKEVKLLSVE